MIPSQSDPPTHFFANVLSTTNVASKQKVLTEASPPVMRPGHVDGGGALCSKVAEEAHLTREPPHNATDRVLVVLFLA